jgi:hypothetical protein
MAVVLVYKQVKFEAIEPISKKFMLSCNWYNKAIKMHHHNKLPHHVEIAACEYFSYIII